MTQMQKAKQGIITPEMKYVAKQENVNEDWLREQIAKGFIVIPKNINHDFLPRAVGKGLSTKINANIGTSDEHCDLEEELRKLDVAVEFGADSIMDLSTGGKLDEIRKKIVEHSNVMIGTVPIYSVMSKLLQRNLAFSNMGPDLLFEEIEEQAKAGVDFVTVHCGITKRTLEFYENDDRLLGVVSRGGSLIKQWMKTNDSENPLYEYYDRLLDICEKYDVTLSLGDGLRPGAQKDASDRGQMAELLILGELVDRARARGVQVMIEGPGHVPLNQVNLNVDIQKEVCKNAPFYVLGPLVTDIAPGYDHIVGAIGGAMAAARGVDFLCYLTPAEHLCLPNEDDVKRGVIATKIAAHAGDIAKGIPGAIEKDHKMSKARSELDWNTMYDLALDPELARDRKQTSESADDEHCTMCGKLCAIRTDRGDEVQNG